MAYFRVVTEPELAELRRIYNEYWERYRDLARDLTTGTYIETAMRGPGLLFLDFLQENSPYWTGNLRTAHAMEIEAEGERRAVMEFFIAEGHEHAIIPGQAHIYGEELVESHRYEDWFQLAVNTQGDIMMEQIMSGFGDIIDKIAGEI